MRKVLLAINAVSPDLPSLDFAAYVGRLTKSPVTGIFLENIAAEERAVFKRRYGFTYVDWEADEESSEHKLKMEVIETNIARFEEGCINREVTYEVRREPGTPTKGLIAESRFADLLILDADTSFNKKFEGTPTDFVINILAGAECPVIIAPEVFTTIDQIVFAYNGTPSSFFAIKQFTYLFPQLYDIKVCVFQINETGEWITGDRLKLKKWLEVYYRNIRFEAVKSRAGEELADHLIARKDMIVVMGAYGRNSLSRFFKHSQADLLIRESFQTIFIAHP